MSSLKESEGNLLTREEAIEWLRKRISELETEIKALKTMLALIEEGATLPESASPSEKTEEVKVSRRTIAKVYIGENYVRGVPLFETGLPSDIEEYIETFISELKDKQALEGRPPEERTKLFIKRGQDGRLLEIRIVNLQTTLEVLKSKATLKYVMDLLYQLYKARSKSQDEI